MPCAVFCSGTCDELSISHIVSLKMDSFPEFLFICCKKFDAGNGLILLLSFHSDILQNIYSEQMFLLYL